MAANILVTMAREEDRNLIGACLEHVAHIVTKADTFHNAMEMLRSKDFDLIVCDVHLQNGGSVFDFLRWVKGDPHMAKTPFVCYSSDPPVVSKYLSDGVKTAARALGAARYILMPKFDGAALLSELEWLIPENKTGNYYSGASLHHNGGDHTGNGASKDTKEVP